MSSMPNWGVPPLLVKAALLSMCMLGFWASVRLMEEFSVVLKPLILALMLAGCLEKAVDMCEFCLARTINIVVTFASCQCNLQPCCAWFGRSKPQDEYIALEQSCIPDEVLADWKVKEEPGKSCVARVFAVVIVLFTAGMGLLYILGSVTSSLEKVNMKTYQRGFNQMETSVLAFMQWIDPKYKEELTKRMNQLETHVASMVLGAFNDILSNTTSFATQLVMFLLYSLMCILSPIKQGEQVFTIVRTYFLYKAICNAVFSLCAWCLLAGIGCDLAVLLSVICFFLSFIPEVGSVICILMPAPVLLFDSRVTMEIRITNLITMAIGMLLIKFAVSNGLESLVMSRSAVLSGQIETEESNDETHPVLILFAVVLCGEIWGVAGMLISVPLLSLVRLLLNLEAAKARNLESRSGRLSYIGEVAKQSSLNSRGGSRQNSRIHFNADLPPTPR